MVENPSAGEMSLRDRFAWEVFQAELASIQQAMNYRRAVEGMASRAYLVADAMLAARQKGGEA